MKNLKELTGMRLTDAEIDRYLNSPVTDEEIDSEIKKVQKLIDSKRASGRSQRILNETIERFFNTPMGNEIKIVDHYEKGAEEMKLRIKSRLDAEYPMVEYEIKNGNLIRKSQTLKEKMLNYLNDLQALKTK